MPFYTFPDQILEPTTNMVFQVYTTDTYSFSSWNNLGGGSYTRDINLNSLDGNHKIYESAVQSPGPTSSTSLITADLSNTGLLSIVSHQIVPALYPSVADYVASNDPPPDFTTDYASATHTYLTYFVFSEYNLTPRIITYPQPVDSLIIFPPTIAAFSQVDTFTNLAAYEIVHNISGSIPITNGNEVDFRNLASYYDESLHQYDLNGVILTVGNSINTQNGGVLSMDVNDNLIYQWAPSSPPVVVPGLPTTILYATPSKPKPNKPLPTQLFNLGRSFFNKFIL